VAHDVFLSYSAKDKTVADAACARLEGAGVRCWMAPRDIRPGAEWGEAILEAIGASRVMVLVFSRHANESAQVRREVERAIHKGVHVVPVRIEDLEPTGAMEYFISSPHWLDALTPPLEAHLDRLVASVRAVLAEPGSAPEEAPARGAEPSVAPSRVGARRPAWPWLLLLLAALVGGVLLLAGPLGGGASDAPAVVSSEPADGATEVPVGIARLRIRFDRDMDTGGHSVFESPAGAFPPLDASGPTGWRDPRTFEVAVERLQPHTAYALQLNSPARQGFLGADGVPLPLTTIHFSTGSR
jgi:hypothetical protein